MNDSDAVNGDNRIRMSVAICAYTDRRWDLLVQAVEEVEKQLRDDDEVLIVIDHAPTLLDRVRLRFPGRTVIENDGQQGLSGARNTAIAHASGDVVAFLDDDAVPAPGWLDTLRSSYDATEILGVGGLVQPSWSKQPPAWMPEEFLWVVGCSYVGLPQTVAPVRNPIGANMSFRRSVFAEVGGFSELLGRVGTLPVGCEETELGIRVGAHYGDGLILHQPAAVVNHHVDAERTTFSYFARRCWSEGFSKAVVSRLAAQRGSLSTERSYITRTVVPGIQRELRSARRGSPAGWLRAAALTVGTALTGGSYVWHSLKGTLARLRHR